MVTKQQPSFNPNFRDDMTLSPYQAKELNSILLASKEDRYKTKMNALSFYYKDPILQTNNPETYVYKPSIRTYNQTLSNPLNINGVPKNSEFQWRSTLRKIEPMKPFISNYTKKEMTGLPERRILKTAEISQPNRNPLLADANLVSTNHFHCGPQPISLNTQVVWEQREVLPADRKISPPKYRTYGYLPKTKLLSSYY